jgi:hypothetical protein
MTTVSNKEKTHEKYIQFPIWNILQECESSNYVAIRITVTCFFASMTALGAKMNRFQLKMFIDGGKSCDSRTQFPLGTLCRRVSLLSKLVLEWQLYAFLS